MVQSELGWILAEAKSGTTVDSSFFRPMEVLAGQFSEGSLVERRLLYDGTESYRRKGVAVTGRSVLQGRAW